MPLNSVFFILGFTPQLMFSKNLPWHETPLSPFVFGLVLFQLHSAAAILKSPVIKYWSGIHPLRPESYSPVMAEETLVSDRCKKWLQAAKMCRSCWSDLYCATWLLQFEYYELHRITIYLATRTTLISTDSDTDTNTDTYTDTDTNTDTDRYRYWYRYTYWYTYWYR